VRTASINGVQPGRVELGQPQPIKPKSNKPYSSKPQPAEARPKLCKADPLLPHRRLTPKEVKSIVDSALDVLKEEHPGDYALLYELYFNGASLHALSRTLHIPRSTLRSRKKKALLHLKSIIENSQN
jgi:DNA-directed RNA polymerase specialized sigma24 family protein